MTNSKTSYWIGEQTANQQWCDNAHDVGRAIGDAHQGAAVVWRQVEVINLEAQVRGSVDADSNCDECNGQSALLLRRDERQADESDHWSPKTDRVEELSGEFNLQDSLVVQPVGEWTQNQAHDHHAEVWKSRQKRVLLDVEVQNVLHVRRNLSQNRPEAPVVGGVNKSQSDDRWRCQKSSPWRLDGLKLFCKR